MTAAWSLHTPLPSSSLATQSHCLKLLRCAGSITSDTASQRCSALSLTAPLARALQALYVPLAATITQQHIVHCCTSDSSSSGSGSIVLSKRADSQSTAAPARCLLCGGAALGPALGESHKGLGAGNGLSVTVCLDFSAAAAAATASCQ
jgi:hypothetical protein